MPSPTVIILEYLCPSAGVILAAAMFGAPVHDLRQALIEGSLGALNPFPWAIMTGNCLGWVVYGYYTHDPFVVAANLPGLVMSLWLNMGASKLQYLARIRARKPSEVEDYTRTSHEDQTAAVVGPQETILFRVLIAWSIVIVWVGWCNPPAPPAHIVGFIVNVNLVFFYGAPLQSIWSVLRSKTSDSIHVPTMRLNWACTSFWLAYGLARRDIVIAVPNGLGLLLGILQGVLCLCYPKSGRNIVAQQEGTASDETAENLVV